MLFCKATSAFGMPGVSTFGATGVTPQPASDRVTSPAPANRAFELRVIVAGCRFEAGASPPTAGTRTGRRNFSYRSDSEARSVVGRLRLAGRRLVLDQRVVLFTADSVKAPTAREVRSRRKAPVADRGLGRLNWAESAGWPNGSKRADRRRSHATAKARTPPRADDGGSLSRIGSAVLRILRRKQPLRDKFAHALHSSVHEREMICDRGSAVRGSMTSPDVRATSRAYVAGLARHKMEELRTNAASGPRLGTSSMTNRLSHPWMKDGAQVIPNIILERRFQPNS